jgi:apolipoprotein N-acyltransferase
MKVLDRIVHKREPVVGGWIAFGLAIVAGVVFFLAFDPVGFGPYVIGGVALLTIALIGRRPAAGFGLGFLAGTVFFALLMRWMLIIGPDAWVLLAVYCGLWIGLIGWGTVLVTRLPLWPLWIAGLWVASEGLRGRYPLGGFPWGRLAFSQSEQDLSAWAYLIGMAGLTGLLALIGASIVAVGFALVRGQRAAVVGWSMVIAVPFLVTTFWQPSADGRLTPIAFVQGGTPQLGMGAMDVRRQVLDNHVRETLALADAIDAGEVARPRFVLWPENSSDIDPFSDPTVAADISRAADAVGVPIVVGAVVRVPGNDQAVWNEGIVWQPGTGPDGRYIKNRPVPFGEFVPFREFLTPIVGRFDRVARDFLPGDEPGVLDAGGVVIGDVICFEVAYDDVVNGVVLGGAEVITVQTNNATYGNTAQPEQQFAIARMRSVENGRSVVVAATTGISAAIAPDRSVIIKMEQNDVGFRVVDVPLRTVLAPSAYSGPIIEFTWSLLALIAAVAGLLWRRNIR